MKISLFSEQYKVLFAGANLLMIGMKITYLVALTLLSGCAANRVAEDGNTFQGYDSAPAPNANTVYKRIQKESKEEKIAKQESDRNVASLDESTEISPSGLVKTDTEVIIGISSIDINKVDDVVILQEALINHGLDPGPIDGKYGRKTRQALAVFRKENNIEPSEGISREDISHLFYTF